MSSGEEAVFDPRQVRYYPDDETPIEIIDVLMDMSLALGNINRNLIAIEAAILGADKIKPLDTRPHFVDDGPFTDPREPNT